MKKLILVYFLLILCSSLFAQKPELKTAWNGVKYWEHGAGDTTVVFLHGNINSPNEQNILPQGPLAYPNGGYRSATDFTLADPTNHHVRIICPINKTVANKYQTPKFVDELMQDPNIRKGKVFVLVGNSFGGLAAIEYYIAGSFEFNAYIIYSPYLVNRKITADELKRSTPIKFIQAQNDNIAPYQLTLDLYNLCTRIGIPTSCHWPAGGTHFASSAIFANALQAKTLVYDWIKINATSNSPTPPVEIKPRRITLYVLQDSTIIGKDSLGNVVRIKQ